MAQKRSTTTESNQYLLNKRYGAWIKSKNDTSTSDDSDSETDNLKTKLKLKKPFNDAPNDEKTKELQGL
jgi:hypothetical protein